MPLTFLPIEALGITKIIKILRYEAILYVEKRNVI